MNYEEYERAVGASPVPVFRDRRRCPNALSAFLSLASRGRAAFLLESVVGGERLARCSVPRRSDPVSAPGHGRARRAVHDAAGEREEADGLLPALRKRLAASGRDPRPAAVHRAARRLLTWDAARLFKRLPDHHGAAKGVVANFAFYDSLVAFRHARQRLVLMALAEPGSRAASSARSGAHRALAEAGPRLGAPAVVEPPGPEAPRLR